MYYFSPQYEFSCDNIFEYEIVITNGDLVIINCTHNADLFEVMYGASSKFGIVTRFDLFTFMQAQMWGGDISTTFLLSHSSQKLFSILLQTKTITKKRP